jgi:hypothetical protein
MQGGYPAGSQPPDPNAPQPPPQQMPQAPQPQPTLGDANQTPGNPLIDHYIQTVQQIEQRMQGLKQPVLPPTPGPSLLESLGTFGIANLKHQADEVERRQYNYKAVATNRDLSLEAAKIGQHLVDSEAQAQALGGRNQLAQAGLALRVAEALRQDFNDKWNREYKLTQGAPKTPDEERMQGPMEPVPGMPGRFRPTLTKNPSTGAWEGPTPGSPAQTALDAVGGGSAAGAASPSPQQPGESRADYVDRTKAANVAKTATGKETATSNLELDRNAKIVESSLSDPALVAAIKGNLLSGVKAGIAGPTYMAMRVKQGAPGTAKLGMLRTDILPALRALEGGTKGMSLRGGKSLEQLGLTKQFEAIVDGRASQEQAQQFIPEVLSRIKEVRDQMGAGPPSSAPAGGSTQPTGATTPTSLDDLLKKHGY